MEDDDRHARGQSDLCRSRWATQHELRSRKPRRAAPKAVVRAETGAKTTRGGLHRSAKSRPRRHRVVQGGQRPSVAGWWREMNGSWAAMFCPRIGIMNRVVW